MAENPFFNIIYTKRSFKDAAAIRSYLLYKFTQREVDNFYKLLVIFENVVKVFPELYPKSLKNPKIHRAVLSKKLSVFYKVSHTEISIVAILDTRVDYSKWP